MALDSTTERINRGDVRDFDGRQVVRLASGTPLGYRQIAVAASGGVAVSLGTIPAGAKLALIISTVAARWRDDGTDPTGAVGMPLTAGTLLEYDASLAAVRLISQGAAGTLDVALYG